MLSPPLQVPALALEARGSLDSRREVWQERACSQSAETPSSPSQAQEAPLCNSLASHMVAIVHHKSPAFPPLFSQNSQVTNVLQVPLKALERMR